MEPQQPGTDDNRLEWIIMIADGVELCKDSNGKLTLMSTEWSTTY